ncbi:hypothetical protein BLA18112_04658 [Burkholderia lata]|uniref:Lipoprotein n=1 Tax=Burkholderia lata (strain ATCC 17760 / DSM 23089 / LMG 22485 / NCIMB 9086 / R18194 / 383) TaxID=482957 RepID=A0A6P2XNS2_BURL3|nr:hypothetical protein [Burkholderia lata]VWD10974.1 hypothetical protein BLA18112_04658 [Burkholderia lata]
MITVNFRVCTPNAIGDTTIVVKDQNNNGAVIFNGPVAQDSCSAAIEAIGNGSGEATLLISANGGGPYTKEFVKDGDDVNVY